MPAVHHPGAVTANATVRIGEAVWEDRWQARHWHYGMTRNATGTRKGCLGAEPSAAGAGVDLAPPRWLDSSPSNHAVVTRHSCAAR